MPAFSLSQPRSVAIGPLAGILFGVAILASPFALSPRGPLPLFNFSGLAIVVGGVVATAFMSFPAADVLAALRAIPAIFREPAAGTDDLRDEMNRVLNWVRQARAGGLPALRSGLGRDSVASPFSNYGLNMVLSEYQPDDVRAMLRSAADGSYEQDCAPVDVLRAMASHAPAFGMIGTLVGMIAMLGELNDNIASVGSTLAIAFLSTLYGVASARMVYMPAAARLQRDADRRHRGHDLVAEGLILLARRETPSRVQDWLNGFLRPEQRDYFDAIDGDPKAGLAASRHLAAPPGRGAGPAPARDLVALDRPGGGSDSARDRVAPDNAGATRGILSRIAL